MIDRKHCLDYYSLNVFAREHTKSILQRCVQVVVQPSVPSDTHTHTNAYITNEAERFL